MATEAQTTTQAGPPELFVPVQRCGATSIADLTDLDAEETARASFLWELAAEGSYQEQRDRERRQSQAAS